MDDILVFGASQEENDGRLENVMRKLSEAGIALNSAKCEFSKDRITFVGHVIDRNGIQPDPKKVSAIKYYDAMQNVIDVRRFLGMVNQLGRFTPYLAEHSKPLRDLLHKDNEFTWDLRRSRPLARLKKN
jgi:membrane protease subunit (stomatin/prohibitin family)